MQHIKELTQEQLETNLKEQEKKVLECQTKYQTINTDLQKQYKKMQVLQTELNFRKLEATKDKPDWEWLLYENGSAGMERHSAAYEAVLNLANIKNERFGLITSGYQPNTKQRVLTIRLYKNDDELTRKVSTALSMLLPLIKPVDIEFKDSKDAVPQKAKILNILDNELSEYATYKAYIDETNNKYVVVQLSYGRQKDVYTGTNLDDLLNHIQNNYYYDTVKPKVSYSTDDGLSM